MDLLRSRELVRLMWVCTVLGLSLCSNPHFVYREDWRERSCLRVLNRVRHQLISSPVPPNITGNWVSYRCEIRSGPEYVVRHFRFQNNTFQSVVYRYQDPDCHVPIYSIQSQGSFKVQQQSWTVRGATEAQYDVTSAYLVTYSQNVSQDLASQLSHGCGDHNAPQHLLPFTRYLVFSSAAYNRSQPPELSHDSPSLSLLHPEDQQGLDCFGALNFTLNELQLILLEYRRHHLSSSEQPHSSLTSDPEDIPGPHRHHHHNHHHHNHQDPNHHTWPDHQRLTRELLLGAVHPRPQERQGHRPSSFQTSLKDSQTPGCGVCSRVAGSDPMYPPRLTIHTGSLLSLEGEWVSTRCESRQYGMFLTRWLHFLSDGSSWQGQYDYYHDALCRMPSFSLYAKGSYAGGTDSKLVQGAKDFSFKVTRLKVTPHDQTTVDSMNHYSGPGCGKPHAWSVDQEQDVTWTGGCVTLGIRLPNMERDIMKMEVVNRKLHLFVGQRLVDKKAGPAGGQERPTAFQEPLIKCDQVNLDMSINTAPGGHGWAGGVALPLSSGPEEFSPLGSRASATAAALNFRWLVVVFGLCWLPGMFSLL